VVDKFDATQSGFVPKDYLIPVNGLQPTQNPPAAAMGVDPFTVLMGSTSNSTPLTNTRTASPNPQPSPPQQQQPSTPLAPASSPTPPNSMYAARQAPLPSHSPQQYQQRQEISPTKMTQIGPIRRLSDPRLEQHLLETLDPEAVHGAGNFGGNSGMTGHNSTFVSSSPTPMTQTTTATSVPSFSVPSLNGALGGAVPGGVVNSDAMPSMPTQAMNEDYSSIVSQHDAWLQDVQGRHTTAFDGLLSSIDMLSTKVLDCENKNNDIVNEIKQLDEFIENERSRWKRRLDSEKLAMSNRVQSLYSGTPALQDS